MHVLISPTVSITDLLNNNKLSHPRSNPVPCIAFSCHVNWFFLHLELPLSLSLSLTLTFLKRTEVLFYGMSDASSRLVFDDPSVARVWHVILCSSQLIKSRGPDVLCPGIGDVCFDPSVKVPSTVLAHRKGSPPLDLDCDPWGGAVIWIPIERFLDPFMIFTWTIYCQMLNFLL